MVKKKIVAGVLVVVVFTAFLLFFARNASAPSNQSASNTSEQAPETPGFNKQLHPIDEPGSIWWIVNKTRPISPIDYAPNDLVVPKVRLRAAANSSEMRLSQETATALESLFTEALASGNALRLTSGYRSYQLQVSVYNGYVQQYGQAGADKISARPGTSEHQTGLAADVEPLRGECRLEACFADLPEGKWVAGNAFRHGFVVRYPIGKEEVTGYSFEPWHLRYVGKELAAQMHEQSILTLEEFFGTVPDNQPY